ncbi:MAG: hypothetical protein QF886_07615, partial [Planctomycetota bacterium]|nr:hypothetical protein [Planctomycetota bacterium]
PSGTGDERTLDCSIDVSAAWGGLVQRCVRRIVSNTPCEFIIEDEIDLPAKRSVSFHLHSKFPWTKRETGWVTRGDVTSLTVRPDWQTVVEQGEEDFVDGRKEPVFHLTLQAAPSLGHRLKTNLEVIRNT